MAPIETTLMIAIVYIAGFISGMWIPARYGMERLEGFGRWTLKKFVPYQPPPGKSEEEAFKEAEGDDSDED